MDIVFNNVLIPDFKQSTFHKGSVGLKENRICMVSAAPLRGRLAIDGEGGCLSPGLVDCHCHVESSFLTPAGFGNVVAAQGTLHAVTDSHEIANVAGRRGLAYFMADAEASPCNIRFAVPSCVPATPFATSGSTLGPSEIDSLLQLDRVVALGELMNVEAVVAGDPRIRQMIEIARRCGKRINGHAPGLSGARLAAYAAAGVGDDHENESRREVQEKLEAGLVVFLREGTAEQTAEEAYQLLRDYPDRIMFCTDDRTIDHILTAGHITFHLRKAVRQGVPALTALRAASYNGLQYYGLPEYAEVREGNRASLVLFEDLQSFRVRKVLVEGQLLPPPGPLQPPPEFLLRTFQLKPVQEVPAIARRARNIAIQARDGSLVTGKLRVDPRRPEYDLERDLLKLAVYERYGQNRRAAARLRGFGLTRGALASSVAHDCHNIVAVGTSDQAVREAVNAVLECGGGLVVYDGQRVTAVELTIGGLVTMAPPAELVRQLADLKQQAKELGCRLTDPFATLSFMALEVIPHLKLTDRGLFDVDRFAYWGS